MIQSLKYCSKCKSNKPIDLFNKNKARYDGLQTHCRECTQKKFREYYSDNKEYHKKQIIKNKKQYITVAKEFIFDYLKNNSCIDCEENDPVVLEFDHVVSDKYKNISDMVHNGNSIISIKKEIEKCEVRCANCHRRKTAKQFGWNINGSIVLADSTTVF